MCVFTTFPALSAAALKSNPWTRSPAVSGARSEMLKGFVRLEFPVAVHPTYFQTPRVPRSRTQSASGYTLL
jgi:hypothetical protein